MELAGIVGLPQEGLRPDLLKHILVKDHEASEQQPGKVTFWVFSRSQNTAVPATTSTEPHGQHVEAATDSTAPEASAEKQASITDFFSPRPSTPSSIVPVLNEEMSRCDMEEPLIDQETAIQQLEQKLEQLKRKQRNSQTIPLTVGHHRSVSGSSNDESSLGSHAQYSESSPASPGYVKEELESNSSSSSSEVPATELAGTSQDEDTETDEAKEETEKYWIEKDEERLVVIANMEKAMAKMKGELANTVTAFHMASDTNYKLQAELERKNTSLSQVEEDLNEVVHDLNAADMNNEKLKTDLAHSRRERKHQFDRAEEALTLVKADPSKETISKLLQAKAEAESRNISKEKEMESEIDTLNSQLKERCDSVARLTESLSRVADSDRWVDVKRELDKLKTQADKLPDQLQAALLECDELKGQYDALQASQEEELQKVHDSGLKNMREIRRQLKDKAATSERALKECLKQVFERMVRCTLCLETQGFTPSDRKHSAICKQVVKLTGEDYQQPLLDYYEEHDIQEEFSWIEDDDEDDDEDDEEKFYYVNSEIQARNEELGRQGSSQEQDDGSIVDHCNVDLHTTNSSSGPADTSYDSSSTPTPAMMEVDQVTATVAEGEEVQGSPRTWEARSKLETAHTIDSSDKSQTAADQATPAVNGPSVVVKGQGAIASSHIVHAVEVLSSSETADEAGDRHLPTAEDLVLAAENDDAEFSGSDEDDAHNKSDDVKKTGFNPDKFENGAVVLEDNCSPGAVFEGENGSVIQATDDAVLKGNGDGVYHETMAHQPDVKRPGSAGDTTAQPRTYLEPKKQARSSHENPVPPPAACKKAESSKDFTFFQPMFTSERPKETDQSTAAVGNGSDTGRTSVFVFGKNSPPLSSGTPVASSKANSGEGPGSSEPLMTCKTAGATSSSTAEKGNSRDIWGGTTAKNDPVSRAAWAADLKVRMKEKPPFLISTLEQKLAEAKTPTSENPEAKQSSEAIKAQKEAAACTTSETSFPTQINFAGDSVPGLFTGSSSSFSARATQPASTGTFSCQEHDSPSITVQPKEKAGEAAVVKGESSKEGVPEIEALKEETSLGAESPQEEVPKVDAPETESPRKEKPKKQMQKEKSAPKEENAPKESAGRAPSEHSRKERKAAKKAQEKAAQKAKNEASNAKARESRRVEKAMMMK